MVTSLVKSSFYYHPAARYSLNRLTTGRRKHACVKVRNFTVHTQKQNHSNYVPRQILTVALVWLSLEELALVEGT